MMAGKTEFRKSQGIVPFGVGAIIDFPEDALMSAGLDAWPSETAEGQAKQDIIHASRIIDGRLARRLSANLGRHINYFLSPLDAPGAFGYATTHSNDLSVGYMPFVRFPEWHFCPRCRGLKRVPWNTQVSRSRNTAMYCDNPGRRIKGNAETCSKLPERRRHRLVPVRFVAACENGHIMDFPWSDWVHRGGGDCTPGPNDLYIYSVGAAGLEGIKVECIKCRKKRSMQGTFTRDRLEEIYTNGCPGNRPWLGPGAAEPECMMTPQTIQRGASNAYFARVVSSILIPPYSEKIQQLLYKPEVWDIIESLPLDGGQLPTKTLKKFAEQHGVDKDAFIQAANERLEGNKVQNNEADDISEEQYRLREYEAFKGARPPREERLDFDPVMRPINQYENWFKEYFEQIVLIRKLRETRALTGFSRVIPLTQGDDAPAKLSRGQMDWLPAMEVRGEGIFLVLNRETIRNWVHSLPGIAERTAVMEKQMNLVLAGRELPRRDILPAFLLVHTFAHLLIRQLSYESGYDSSDLRERLYVSGNEKNPMHGLLIYTASGDSEGTMGGLVRQGEPGRLEGTVRATVSNSLICSSDPLCIESKGQGVSSLNLAACHACSLLPETSCEEGNKLLDRALVVGTPENPALGYFKSLL